MTKNNKILLVGGGTGGHAAPILALYQKLKQLLPASEIIVVGVGTIEEKKFFESISGYKIIRSGKLHRYFTLKNLHEAASFLIGIFQAFMLLIKIKPAVIFSKGGYSSLPIVLCARILRIPYYLHESDIEIGKVNLAMAHHAEKVFVTYPVENYPLSREKLVFSGPILRKSFYDQISTRHSDLSFEKEKPIILITGGSQGALPITKYFIGSAQNILAEFNVILQAGKHSIKEATSFFETLSQEEKKSLYMKEFLKVDENTDEMHEAIAMASLVVTRASSTIAEIAALGKPMILIPWKHSAQDHQLKNAKFIEERTSLPVILDDELDKKPLYAEIEKLISDRDKLSGMTSELKNIFPGIARDVICEELLKKIEGRSE